MENALVRELTEELAITPRIFTEVMNIPDPNSLSDPAIYHVYSVHSWKGHPRICDDEHSEVRWFKIEEAMGLQDLALNEYLTLFDRLRSLPS